MYVRTTELVSTLEALGMQPSRQSLMGMGGVNANSFPTGISAGQSACGRHRGRFCRRPRGGSTWRAGNADSKGSPIIHTFTKKNESFLSAMGARWWAMQVNACCCCGATFIAHPRICLEGLTFRQWQAQWQAKMQEGSGSSL